MSDEHRLTLEVLAKHVERMDEEMIDPQHFGEVKARVGGLEDRVKELSGKIDQLLELANKSRGGFLVAIGLAGMFGGLITALLSKLLLVK